MGGPPSASQRQGEVPASASQRRGDVPASASARSLRQSVVDVTLAAMAQQRAEKRERERIARVQLGRSRSPSSTPERGREQRIKEPRIRPRSRSDSR